MDWPASSAQPVPEPIATYSTGSLNTRVGIVTEGAETSNATCQATLGTGECSRHEWRRHHCLLSPSSQARKKAVGRLCRRGVQNRWLLGEMGCPWLGLWVHRSCRRGWLYPGKGHSESYCCEPRTRLRKETDRKQWHPSTSREQCWVSAETPSSPSRDYPAWKQSFPASILLQSLQLFPQVLVLRCHAGAVSLGLKHGSWNGTLQPQVPKGAAPHRSAC